MIEMLEKVAPGGKYHAPTWRVRCTLCGDVYLRTGTASNATRTLGCKDCNMRRQRERLTHGPHGQWRVK